MKKLIIVESPTKARTIGQYLGREYQVVSSQGHVRDLPKNGLGVNIEQDFTPEFETKRNKVVTQLREAAKGAERVYLATDHDREGEAIAFDLFTILNRVVKDESAFARPVFNEITKPVILDALKEPGTIDLKKVEAQRTRRILDRLMGYLVSPLLSRTIAGSRFAGLSAGRVQSVALRFLCDREAEITAFVPEEYWEIDAHLTDGEPFVASVTEQDGEKLSVPDAMTAETIAEGIRAAGEICVVRVEEKERKRNPAAPFITSTLQQAASSQLGFAPQRTMRVAQELYEGIALAEGTEGLITYMRTDSVRVSEAAIEEARRIVASTYGEEYLSAKARTYKNKRRSQDAHEAIRPTDEARTPDSIATYLSADQLKLYSLIYGRFLATQMAPAVYRHRKIALAAGAYTLEATGSTLEFDGFLRALAEPRTTETTVPADLCKGDTVALEGLETRQKFTEPPRRYSEAGLVNVLEKEGIGRPSTYASIVSVIQERGYAAKDGGSLKPTLLGQMVVDFLRRHFAETVNPRFTAHLEEDLDEIEEGNMSRVDALAEFYGPFAERLAALEGEAEEDGRRVFQVASDVTCEVCGSPMELRYWKGSFFLGCTNYPTCRHTVNLPPTVPVRYEGDRIRVKDALAAAAAAERADRIPCADCGSDMELKVGRFGRYYKCTNPDCGHTAPVSTGVSCPSCHQGELIEKYSAKRRRTFYSCNRYPDCRYATSERPIRSCPACGAGVLVAKKDGELRCTNTACGYRETPSETTPLPPEA